MSFTNKNNLYSNALLFVLLSFFSTFLIIEQRNYYYNAPLVCILMGFACLYRDIKQDQFDKSRLPLGVMAAFAFYTLSSLSIFFIQPEQFHLYKPDLAPLIAIPIIYTVFSSSMTTKQLSLIFAVGAIVVGLIGFYDKYILDLSRALINRQPIIPAGAAAMVLGLFCVNAAAYYRRRSAQYFALFMFAALLGILGSILTGSRGTWLPLFLMVWAFAYKFSEGRWQWFSLFILIFVVMAVVVYFIPQTGVQLRLSQAYNDVSLYFSGGYKATSLGLRFEFWKSAIDGFVERPLFGWGEQYQLLKETQLADGTIIKKAAASHYTHAHNQYLDNLVRKGLLGFFALLALLLVPLKFYWSAWRNSSSEGDKLLAEYGMILVISTVLFCLSDVFLGLQLGMLFYTFTNAILIGLLSRNMGKAT